MCVCVCVCVCVNELALMIVRGKPAGRGAGRGRRRGRMSPRWRGWSLQACGDYGSRLEDAEHCARGSGGR